MFSRMLDRVDSSVGPVAFLDIADLSSFELVSTYCCCVSKKPAHRPSLNIPHTTKPHGTTAWIIDRKFCTSATSLSFTTFWEQYNIHERRIATGAFKKLLSTCHGLTSLDLSRNRRCCGEDKHYDHGKDWYYDGFNDDTLAEIIEGCPGVTNLNVSKCDGLTDRALEAIAFFCPKLESLDISGCFFEPPDYDWPYHVDDDGNETHANGFMGITHWRMRHLKNGCPSLATIHVGWGVEKRLIEAIETELNRTARVKTRVTKPAPPGYYDERDGGYEADDDGGG
jgi:hypothetical protein